MPFLLNTNLLRDALTPDAPLARRIARAPEDYFLSIVTVREVLRGALASVAEAESSPTRFLPQRYDFLFRLLQGISGFAIQPYPDSAEALFQSWPKSLHRIGPNDCRIAASAIVADRIVLTRNISDFARIAAHDTRLLYLLPPSAQPGDGE